jgi:hypothetical protein
MISDLLAHLLREQGMPLLRNDLVRIAVIGPANSTTLNQLGRGEYRLTQDSQVIRGGAASAGEPGPTDTGETPSAPYAYGVLEDQGLVRTIDWYLDNGIPSSIDRGALEKCIENRLIKLEETEYISSDDWAAALFETEIILEEEIQAIEGIRAIQDEDPNWLGTALAMWRSATLQRLPPDSTHGLAAWLVQSLSGFTGKSTPRNSSTNSRGQ